MIKVILFDFYGVFIPDGYNHWLELNSLKRDGDFARLIEELDTSRISEEFFLAQLSRLTGRDVQISEIHVRNQQPNTELVDLVQELRTNYTISLLSNASTKLRSRLESMDLSFLFDKVIVSSEIGFAKPSSEAFHAAIQILEVEAREILFVDDNILNVEAARTSGMHAVQYQTVEHLREYFDSQKIT